MKFILKNPTEEQLVEVRKLGLPIVYLSGTEIHIDIPEISEDDITADDVIDLGLPSGLKWASCNIGADKPCDYGLLFQWGRVDGYAYDDPNNQFNNTYSNPPTTSGTVYYEGDVLSSADDAAYVATNGALRMPTIEEIDELLAGTTNQWVTCAVLGEDHTSHTVYGRLFTSKTNSNNIFIPAAGYFNGPNSFINVGSYGRVWSSSATPYFTFDASALYFESVNCNRTGIERYCGLSVRGVCE